jgi:hypothetical protein
MLKNLGHAYALDNQFKHALLALVTYLERAASAAERPGLEERVTELKAQVAQEERRHKDSTRDSMAKSAGRPGGETPKNTSNQSPSAADASPSETSEPSVGSRSPIPLALAGVGAITLGLGAVKWVGAKQDETKAAKACPSHDECNPSDAKAGNAAVDREIMWTLVGGAGAALLVGGVVWYLVQSPEPDAKQLSSRKTQSVLGGLQPELGFGYAGLRWIHAL